MAATTASYQIILLVSCFTSAFLFVTALVFSFAVMPGIATLDDTHFLHAFQVMDRIIQDMQPVFAVLWIGSIPSIFVSLILGIVVITDSSQSYGSIITMAQVLVLGLATTAVLVGQVVTLRVNIPLNNRVQNWLANSLTSSPLGASGTCLNKLCVVSIRSEPGLLVLPLSSSWPYCWKPARYCKKICVNENDELH